MFNSKAKKKFIAESLDHNILRLKLNLLTEVVFGEDYSNSEMDDTMEAFEKTGYAKLNNDLYESLELSDLAKRLGVEAEFAARLKELTDELNTIE